jgi:predicted DNA-binding transcriptional regulator AlpA
MNEIKPTPIQGTRPAQAELLTDVQTAEILAVEPRTLRLWRNTRGLPHIKITSKVIRYRRADVDAWLERRRTVIPPHRTASRTGIPR